MHVVRTRTREAAANLNNSSMVSTYDHGGAVWIPAAGTDGCMRLQTVWYLCCSRGVRTWVEAAALRSDSVTKVAFALQLSCLLALKGLSTSSENPVRVSDRFGVAVR